MSNVIPKHTLLSQSRERSCASMVSHTSIEVVTHVSRDFILEVIEDREVTITSVWIEDCEVMVTGSPDDLWCIVFHGAQARKNGAAQVVQIAKEAFEKVLDSERSRRIEELERELAALRS